VLELLRHDVPMDVHYRHDVRGHQAWRGQPTITRPREPRRTALPWVLGRFESSACYALGRKGIPAAGRIGFFGRDTSLTAGLANSDMNLLR
jgi:hypothetical protein